MIFKPDVDPRDLDNMSPAVIMLIAFYFQFCFEHQLDCKVTSLIRPNDKGPHRDGRAVDLRINTWSEFYRDKFKHEVETRYNYLGAYSKSDGVQRVLIYHDAGVPDNLHCHLQTKH